MARQKRSISVLPKLDYGRAKVPRNVYDMFAEGSFTVILLQLEHGEQPNSEELAKTLESNPDQPLPPALHAYLCS